MSVQFSQPGLLDAYKQVLQQRESSLFLYSTLPPPSRSLSILEDEKRENDKVGGGDLLFSWRSSLIPGSWLSRGNRLGSLHPRNGRSFIGIEILFLRCVENLSLSNHLSCSFEQNWTFTGSGGLEELEDEFNDGKVQFAFCRVKDPNTKLDKFVLISWVSPSLSYPLKNDLKADRRVSVDSWEREYLIRGKDYSQVTRQRLRNNSLGQSILSLFILSFGICWWGALYVWQCSRNDSSSFRRRCDSLSHYQTSFRFLRCPLFCPQRSCSEVSSSRTSRTSPLFLCSHPLRHSLNISCACVRNQVMYRLVDPKSLNPNL